MQTGVGGGAGNITDNDFLYRKIGFDIIKTTMIVSNKFSEPEIRRKGIILVVR